PRGTVLRRARPREARADPAHLLRHRSRAVRARRARSRVGPRRAAREPRPAPGRRRARMRGALRAPEGPRRPPARAGARRGRARVRERFGLERMVEETLAVYREVVPAEPAPAGAFRTPGRAGR